MPRAKDPERAETEARLQQAIAEYKKRQKKNPNENKSSIIRRVAKDFNIPRKTLEGRLKGCVAHNPAHESLMHLTINEEKELVHWITTLIQHGYAPRYTTIRELAEIIRNRPIRSVNGDDIQLVNYDTFGKDWVPILCHVILNLKGNSKW
jgi:hypothetical protein